MNNPKTYLDQSLGLKLYYFLRFRVNGKIKVSSKWNPDGIPFNLKPRKGSHNVVLTREFATFLVTHPVAQEYFNFTKSMLIPDEHFYSMLGTVKVEETKEGEYEVSIIVGLVTSIKGPIKRAMSCDLLSGVSCSVSSSL